LKGVSSAGGEKTPVLLAQATSKRRMKTNQANKKGGGDPKKERG